jgi:hypothetical protein
VAAVTAYLADQLRTRQAWAVAFDAFDLLDQAVLVIDDGPHTFRDFYHQVVDQPMANDYLRELSGLADVEREGPGLWARYARRIVQEIAARNLVRPEVPAGRLLLSYLLYWWGAFARGYALEVTVYRDLQRSGVHFQAHDLLHPVERYSASDLTVSDMAGDIKTSVYFLQAAHQLRHDFYIVRLWIRGQRYTLVVLLQPEAWDTIDGDTLAGSLENAADLLPAPVRIRHQGHELVVLDYVDWKQRVLRYQGVDQ